MIGGSHEADIEQGMIDGSVADFRRQCEIFSVNSNLL